MKMPIAALRTYYYKNDNGKIEMDVTTEDYFAELNFKFPIEEFTEQLQKEIEKDGKFEGTITVYLKPIKFKYTLIT